MHRTEAQNNVGGLFTDGPPGTTMGAAWANAVQEEIVKIITESGITLCTQGNETRDQLYNALISSTFWTKMGLTITKTELNSMTFGAYLRGLVIRPRFSYKDTDEIYITSGMYQIEGSSTTSVYWKSTLTFQFGPGGSNPGSDALGIDDWFYLYLDDSAIATLGSREITAAQLVAVTTEPAWSDAKGGWYNGNDRCVFAIKTEAAAANVFEFWHDGDFVLFARHITDRAAAALNDVPAAVALTAPKFTRKVFVKFYQNWIANTDTLCYRPADNVDVVASCYVAYCSADDKIHYVPMMVLTDSSQNIEIFHGAVNNNQVGVYTQGWYFPIGM